MRKVDLKEKMMVAESQRNGSRDEAVAESATTTDCISRQDAIEALMAHFIPQTYTGEQVEQAEKLAQKIMNKVPPVTPKVSEDCISRADALDEFKKDYDDVFDLMTAIEELPSVTPTERAGEWVRRYCFQRWKCSECEYEIDGKTNYCPNCGADMRGDE